MSTPEVTSELVYDMRKSGYTVKEICSRLDISNKNCLDLLSEEILKKQLGAPMAKKNPTTEWVASVAGFTCGDLTLNWSEQSLEWRLYNFSDSSDRDYYLSFDDEELRQLHAITTAFMKAAESDE